MFKITIIILLIVCPFFSNSQCSFSFKELESSLALSESNLNVLLRNKGYVFDNEFSNYFCQENFLFRRYTEDGVKVIDFLMHNSHTDINSIINDAKSLGMKLTESRTNNTTGKPINIYEGRNNIMMQISSNDKYHSITIYGM
jgi:hypothetical protein